MIKGVIFVLLLTFKLGIMGLRRLIDGLFSILELHGLWLRWGLFALGLLGICVMVPLRVVGVISSPWWVVTMPIWGLVSVAVGFPLFITLLGIIGSRGRKV